MCETDVLQDIKSNEIWILGKNMKNPSTFWQHCTYNLSKLTFLTLKSYLYLFLFIVTLLGPLELLKCKKKCYLLPFTFSGDYKVIHSSKHVSPQDIVFHLNILQLHIM